MADLDTATLIRLYTDMSRIRLFEEQAITLFRDGELPGFIHASIGQEAIAVGCCHYLEREDLITSTHRGHGHLIAKGAPLEGMFAELMGLEGGLCHGRGGSMHIMDASIGILGANGIVGGGIPIAVGAALGLQQRRLNHVVVCFFGDGAVNTGSFHEALNLAGLWSLPVIFVCENNQYAESTPFASVVPIPDLMPRAASYGIPGRVIDGNDVLAVLDAAEEAINRARGGGGPTFIQAETYRWYGHHTGDVAPYRTSEEVDSWKQRDPLEALATVLRGKGNKSHAHIKAAQEGVAGEIAAALAAAKRFPPPNAAELERDVFATTAKEILL
jgi:acetoin:2,6-dichlorophenolindophenol oxidoreductase subunit alpha